MMLISTGKPRPKSTLPVPHAARRDEEITFGVSAFRVLAFGTAGMTCLLALLPATGHDQMWCLYVAGRMLHGVRLYGPQLLESNPPLIMWMLLAPVSVARLLHLPATLVFKLGVVALAILSGLLCRDLLRRLNPRLSRTALWAYCFAFIAICGAMPARDFGQREHLLVLLCLPYILAAALEAMPGEPRNRVPLWAGIAIGIAAGLGLSLKPHHLLLPLAVEAALALKRGSLRGLLRPEPIAILATCVAYLAAIRWFTPEYLTGILPILRDTYWAIGDLTLKQLIAQSVELHLLAALAIGLGLALGWRRAEPMVPLLLVSGAASSLAYYMQGTGWYYQQIPAISFFAFALSMELRELAVERGLRAPAWAPKATAGLVVVAIALTAHFSGYTLARPLSFPSGLSATPDPSFFDGLSAGDPVAILTTVVDDSVPPVAIHRLLWAQRENNLWTLPAILRNQSPDPRGPRRSIPPERLAQLDRMQHAWMVEDLARWKPLLVLVARCQDIAVHCQVIEDRHDDLLAWFERDPDFREAWRHYHFVRSSGSYDAYARN